MTLHAIALCAAAYAAPPPPTKTFAEIPLPFDEISCFAPGPPEQEKQGKLAFNDLEQQQQRFLEMNESFALQYLGLAIEILRDVRQGKKRWRRSAASTGSRDIFVLRPRNQREPFATYTSIVIEHDERWTKMTWMGNQMRWSKRAVVTESLIIGCVSETKMSFYQRGALPMQCWTRVGQPVACDSVRIATLID